MPRARLPRRELPRLAERCPARPARSLVGLRPAPPGLGGGAAAGLEAVLVGPRWRYPPRALRRMPSGLPLAGLGRARGLLRGTRPTAPRPVGPRGAGPSGRRRLRPRPPRGSGPRLPGSRTPPGLCDVRLGAGLRGRLGARAAGLRRTRSGTAVRGAAGTGVRPPSARPRRRAVRVRRRPARPRRPRVERALVVGSPGRGGRAAAGGGPGAVRGRRRVGGAVGTGSGRRVGCPVVAHPSHGAARDRRTPPRPPGASGCTTPLSWANAPIRGPDRPG